MASLAYETALILKEIDPDAIVAAYGIGRPQQPRVHKILHRRLLYGLAADVFSLRFRAGYIH